MIGWKSKRGHDALPGAGRPCGQEQTLTAEWPESPAYLEAKTGGEWGPETGKEQKRGGVRAPEALISWFSKKPGPLVTALFHISMPAAKPTCIHSVSLFHNLKILTE